MSEYHAIQGHHQLYLRPTEDVTVLPAFHNDEQDAFTAVVSKDGCPGYCITHRDGQVTYIYLNASSSDGEGGSPCVFLYIGTEFDPCQDGAAHFYDIDPEEYHS